MKRLCKRSIEAKRGEQKLDDEALEHKSVLLATKWLEEAMDYNDPKRTRHSPYASKIEEAVAWARLGEGVKRQLRGMRRKIQGIDLHIRTLTACNANIPVNSLRRLADSSNDYIRMVIANNPNAPSDILDRIAELSGEQEVLDAVKGNPNISLVTKYKIECNHCGNIEA